MMRQAGRYMQEYQNLRKKHGFITLMSTPELAAEITMQPIRRFHMDAAILFSDILITATALGSNLEFIEKRGPVIDNPIRSQADFDAYFDRADSDTFAPVYDAIQMILKECPVPLLGFAGAPFTVASYMIEGGSSKTLENSKAMMTEAPELFHRLLDRLCDANCEYLEGQIKAGVQGVQLFDTWTQYLSDDEFNTASLPYLKKLTDHIRSVSDIPITIFCKGTQRFLEPLKTLDIDMISVDTESDIQTVQATTPQSIGVQGNLDPLDLLKPLDELMPIVDSLLEKMGGDPHWIFNLGHGITPKTPVENVEAVVQRVQNFQA